MARRVRVKKGTQRQTVDAVKLFGTDEMRDRFDGRVLELVMGGHTVGAAEKIAAQELVNGRRPE